MTEIEIYEILKAEGGDMMGLAVKDSQLAGYGKVFHLWDVELGKKAEGTVSAALMDAAARGIAKEHNWCVECHVCSDLENVQVIDAKSGELVSGSELYTKIRHAVAKALISQKEEND